MSSGAGPSATPPAERFPLARLTVIPTNRPKKPVCKVRLAISHRLYWRVLDSDIESAPASLFDFNHQSSLSFERLSSTATWRDVTNEVLPYGENDLSFIFTGHLHGRARKMMLTTTDECSVVLTAHTKADRDRWMHEIRLRISPPHVLRELAKILLRDGKRTWPGSDEMKHLFDCGIVEHHVDELEGAPCKLEDEASSCLPKPPNRANRIHTAISKVDWIEKINAQLASWADILATAVKKGADASEVVANNAEDVAAFAKFIPGGVSAIFQLVALSARLAVMFAEASRGMRELPGLLAQVMNLLDFVAKSVASILHAQDTLVETERILEGNVFEVLVDTFDLSGEIEEQLVQSNWGRRVLDSHVLKEIESKILTLRQKVVSVAITTKMQHIEGGVTANKLEVAVVKEDLVGVRHDVKEVRKEIHDLKLNTGEGFLSTGLPPRPSPSPFFVGRQNELHFLRKVVEECGSAAITGLGGVGKTQLMATFAERTHLNDDIPGGVFWLTADGKAEDIIESLAAFAEKLHGRKMRNEDRVKRQVVVDVIQKGLNKVNGRWLLCLDNVDYAGEPDVSVILGTLTSMARDDGWVIVTSRAGNSKLWMRMKKRQNMALKPLSIEESMDAMLRLKESIATDEMNDEAVRTNVQRLEEENQIEFGALRELAECLSGLPLAVAQAGAYVSSQDCSFSEYIRMFRVAGKMSDFDRILRRTEDELAPVREEQRAVFSTWNLSVERLSEEAISMLQAIAMFGNAPIPGNLLKEVLKEISTEIEAPEIRFSKVILEELICDSSLVQRLRSDTEDVFDVHRLVRLFILARMEDFSSQTWAMTLSRTIKATYSYVGSMLNQAGKGFYDNPEGHGDRQLHFLPHVSSILHHREKHEFTGLERELVDLHHFTGSILQWKGRFCDAEQVFNALLNMQHAIHGLNASELSIAGSLYQLGIVAQHQGKLNQAEKFYDKSLRMKLAIHGPDRRHLSLSGSYHQLSRVFYEQGKLDQAEKMCNKALELVLENYGSEVPHSRVALSYHQLGIVYHCQGKLDRAEKMFDKSLEMRLAVHGSDTPNLSISNSFHDLGIVYQEQGRLKQLRRCTTKV